MKIHAIVGSRRLALTLGVLFHVLVPILLPRMCIAEAAGEDIRVRRFALLAGANDGGSDRIPLRYAISDARAVQKVLTELGGVARADHVLLVDPSPTAFAEAFRTLEGRLEASRRQWPGSRLELVVYYSGHADDRGLLLGGERLEYGTLKAAIRALPADVHIAIVDACASGALARAKGGIRRPPLLVDAASEVSGHAFLTSASADESAQESDLVQASYFTHYLLSGLRGAADTTGDRRVTLNEAYQFAYHETLARTEQSRIGTQHPNYDLQLSGQGDVVLTDLRGASAGLQLAPELGGRLFIRDGNGRLVAELAKVSGRPMSLGFEPGAYSAVLHSTHERSEARFTLSEASPLMLGPKSFSAFEGEVSVARGGAGAGFGQGPSSIVAVSVLPPLDTNYTHHPEGEADNYASLSILVGKGRRLRGLGVAGIGALQAGDVEGLQLAGVFSVVRANTYGLRASGVFSYVEGEQHGLDVAGVFNGNEGGSGVQAAGVFNLSSGAYAGSQLAGVTNIGEQVTGAQLSAVANVGGDVTGAQISLVNVARHISGVQIGLVNVADSMDGVPIGLVNIIGDGILEMGVWSSDLAVTHVGLKMGSRSFYTILATSLRPSGWFGVGLPETEEEIGFFGAGFGGRIQAPNGLHFDVDFIHYIGAEGAKWHDSEAHHMITRARVLARQPITDELVFFGGGNINIVYSGDEMQVQSWPGLVLGVDWVL
ncbi:MAG: caspase domain-containing protein [Bradymonadia bacterium]